MNGNLSKSAFFEGGWVILSADFTGKGTSATNHCWYQSSRVIALSCGIKISAVRLLFLSQCTRVTDGQTDRQTDRITTPKTALAYGRAVERTGNPGTNFCHLQHTHCMLVCTTVFTLLSPSLALGSRRIEPDDETN